MLSTTDHPLHKRCEYRCIKLQAAILLLSVCSECPATAPIVGHTDYQTTANIYTHVRDGMLKKSTVNMGDVFRKREE